MGTILQNLPISIDAWLGPDLLEDQARVLAAAGLHDETVERIRQPVPQSADGAAASPRPALGRPP